MSKTVFSLTLTFAFLSFLPSGMRRDPPLSGDELWRYRHGDLEIRMEVKRRYFSLEKEPVDDG